MVTLALGPVVFSPRGAGLLHNTRPFAPLTVPHCLFPQAPREVYWDDESTFSDCSGNLWSEVRSVTFPSFCFSFSLSRQTWSECARLLTRWLASPPRPTRRCPRGLSTSWTCPRRWWQSRCGERKWVLEMKPVATATLPGRRCPSQTGIIFSSAVPIESLRVGAVIGFRSVQLVRADSHIALCQIHQTVWAVLFPSPVVPLHQEVLKRTYFQSKQTWVLIKSGWCGSTVAFLHLENTVTWLEKVCFERNRNNNNYI